MIHARLIILALFASISGFCQTFDDIAAMADKDLKEFIESQPQVCELPDSGWKNTVQSNIKHQWNTGISLIHIGSFDNYISLENMLFINDLQRETSQVKFFIVANSKFKYSEKEYADFVNQIGRASCRERV